MVRARGRARARTSEHVHERTCGLTFRCWPRNHAKFILANILFGGTVQRGGPMGDRAYRGGTEIIVIASDKPRATSTRFHYMREQRMISRRFYPPGWKVRSLTVVTIRSSYRSLFLYTIHSLGRDAARIARSRGFSAVYARVKARIGLNGEIRMRVLPG